MTLQERLTNDNKEALKARDSKRRTAVSFLLAEVKRLAIDKRQEALSDAEAVPVLQKQLKMRQESLEQARKANREDLAADNLYEIDIIQSYLPKVLSDDDTKALAQAVVTETGAKTIKEMGAVMAEAAKREPGVDKGLLSKHVKALLGAG